MGLVKPCVSLRRDKGRGDDLPCGDVDTDHVSPHAVPRRRGRYQGRVGALPGDGVPVRVPLDMKWSKYLIIFDKIHFVCFNFFKDIISFRIVIVNQ